MNYLISINLCIHTVPLNLLQKSINSIINQSYSNYELIIICDGVTDNNINEYIETICTDPRIIIIKHEWKGISYSRNVFLNNAKGDIFTYLDSDNYWNVDYLKYVNDTYQDTSVMNAYCKYQTINNNKILFKEFNYETLLVKNFIDNNTYSHRKELYIEFGGYDEKLNRLVDWDLLIRYTKKYEPKLIDYIGLYYNNCEKLDRITNIIPVANNHYYITKKYNLKNQPKLYENKKILYVVFHYKQLSESYIDWEMEYLIENGALIEIFVDSLYNSSPLPHNMKIHTSLNDAISDFKPDLIHIHWLNIYTLHCNTLKKYNIPITIKSHGFEIKESTINSALTNVNVKKILTYQHYYDIINNNKRLFEEKTRFAKNKLIYENQKKIYNNVHKLIVTRVPINPKIHYPPIVNNKDKRLVIRVGAGLKSKDIPLYLKLANNMFKFNFVLCLIKCTNEEYYVDELIKLNENLGGRCVIHVNFTREQTADLMRQSSIYLHTTNSDVSFGQPISIAEAMACGNYIIARKMDEMTKEYIGECGSEYTTYEEAYKLVMDTLNWNESKWNEVIKKSVDYCYNKYVPEKALINLF